MALREIESTLPPGFRFFPSDEELVCHYLHKKAANERIAQGSTLVEVDLHAREPWELPEVAKLTASEWYFFSFRDRKYATGSRTNRATKTGYWKATGKDREVRGPASSSSSSSSRAVVGMRKTLVFYQGRAPNGVKTGWVMHEFRLDSPHSQPREDWVLCRVFQKRKGDGDGGGPQDSGGAASPTFTGSMSTSSQLQPPDHRHAAAAVGGYYVESQLAAGYSAASFANPTQPAVPQYPYGGAVIGFPEEFCSTRGGGGGVADEYGFGTYLDMGFEIDDTASVLGGIRFPQGWN